MWPAWAARSVLVALSIAGVYGPSGPDRVRPPGRASRTSRPARPRGPSAIEAASVIDFSLSDENRLVRDSARSFVEAEILPNVRGWDERGEVHREVFERMAALGFLGAPIPEAYGGAGMDYISFAILCEE